MSGRIGPPTMDEWDAQAFELRQCEALIQRTFNHVAVIYDQLARSPAMLPMGDWSDASPYGWHYQWRAGGRQLYRRGDDHGDGELCTDPDGDFEFVLKFRDQVHGRTT